MTGYDHNCTERRNWILDACPRLDAALSLTLHVADGQSGDALFALALHGTLVKILEAQVAYLRVGQKPADLDDEATEGIAKLAWPHVLRAEAWLEHFYRAMKERGN